MPHFIPAQRYDDSPETSSHPAPSADANNKIRPPGSVDTSRVNLCAGLAHEDTSFRDYNPVSILQRRDPQHQAQHGQSFGAHGGSGAEYRAYVTRGEAHYEPGYGSHDEWRYGGGYRQGYSERAGYGEYDGNSERTIHGQSGRYRGGSIPGQTQASWEPQYANQRYDVPTAAEREASKFSWEQDSQWRYQESWRQSAVHSDFAGNGAYGYYPEANSHALQQPGHGSYAEPRAYNDGAFTKYQQQHPEPFQGQTQWYASAQYPNFVHQQCQQHAQDQSWASLTHQGSTANNLPPTFFNGNAPSYVPINAYASKPVAAPAFRLANDLQSSTLQQPLRYGQQHQRTVKKSFDPILFNPAFFVPNVPPPPTDNFPIPPSAGQELSRRQLRSRTAKEQAASTELPIRSPRPRRSSSPRLSLLKRPKPSPAYLKQADRELRTLDQPRKLLLVLDLNGTLLHRSNRGSSFIARPRVAEFLHYLLTVHKVMIWSSARPENVGRMCAKLFTPQQRQQLVGLWARDKLQLTPSQYDQKVQVYKQLSWVWRDGVVASSCVEEAKGKWSQANTVLIDDSVEKAVSEPYNLLKIDEFAGGPGREEPDVLGQVVTYLEVLATMEDVSAAIKRMPFVYDGSAAAYDWLPIVNEMRQCDEREREAQGGDVA